MDRALIEEATDVARAAVQAAGRAAIAWFRTDLHVERKPDRTPVTAADRAAEEAILDVIRARFPDHAVLAEESGEHRGARSGHRWIVDPLDGTRGFARGGTFWGPLVAFELDGVIAAGALALPALGTGAVYFAGRGLGAWRDGTALRVSAIDDWSEATLSVGEPRVLLAPPWRDAVLSLATTAASARSYGDLAGAVMLLDGRAEAWIEAGARPWDLGPLPVLVDEAGGRFTDARGAPSVMSGSAVATNGRLHAHVLAALAGVATG